MEKIGKRLNKNTIWFVLTVLLVFMPSQAFSLDITASVDKTRITLEDSVFMKITINGGKGDPDMSVIRDFKVFPRGTTSQYQSINGKSEHKTIYQYLLVPRSKGEFTIPAIAAVVDGHPLSTQPISIQVIDQMVKPDEVKALFAQASVIEPTLFVGQQTIYTVKFFTSRRLAGLGFENQPGFKNFTAKPFPSEKTYSLNLKGRTFQVTRVDYLVIPSAPGSYTIDPVSFIAKVRVKNRQDPFDSFFNDSFFSTSGYKPVRVASNPVKIEVRPLPDYSGNEPFSGLVGRFDIHAALDKTHLAVGESATFTIEVTGAGNIMDAGLPTINLDHLGFKIYDDNPADDIGLTDQGYAGTRTFKKALVPVAPGQYRIDPVSLVYFDTKKKQYQKILTQAISLTIAPSKTGSQTAETENSHNGIRSTAGPEPGAAKQEVSLLNKDILDVKDGLHVLDDHQPITPLHFFFFLLLPAVLFAVVRLFFVFQTKDVSSEKRMLAKAAHHLKQARKMQSAQIKTMDETFLSHLYSSLVAAIFAKADKTGETLTPAEIKEILDQAGTDKAVADEAVDLMATMESVRFGGKKMDEHSAHELFSNIKRVVKLLCCLLVCLGTLSFLPLKAAADVTYNFTNGMKYYRAGQFHEAAMAFEAVAGTPVRNPYLYYDIGNAYLKAGDIGHAILWYERAKLLAPNDPDLLFNLKYANSLVKDKAEMEIGIWDVLFFWDRFANEKTLRITAISFSGLFFLWAGIRTVQRKKILSGKGVLLLSLLILSGILVGADHYKQTFRRSAVIVVKETGVRSGTAPEATTLFSLHAGSKVRVEEQRGNYWKIAFSKQMVGWVDGSDLIVIR